MHLTRRQREILEYIREYIGDHQYAPSFEEIAKQFQFNSLATVHEHLTNLEQKGFIKRTHNESRSIELAPEPGMATATELPLLGYVAAGLPIEAVSTPETIAVPDTLIPRGRPSYVLQVQGQSMIDDHIQDGDFVVVQNQETAHDGQMVIALLEGESATVKRFYREDGGWIRLQPANESMSPIKAHEDDLKIQGVVVGVIRKY
ncbi:MAG: transcriptional repressor LexA [Gemmatimonadota bacterium]|nr:transcriptional repressor LexA [Gemmatimonadota bacterium]MDH5804895.1 transcriptional repressor LexA [Gemmatimonadota bacterium]